LNEPEPATPGNAPDRDPLAVGEAALDRAREVSKRIAERVKKLTEAETTEQVSLPSDPTDEVRPV